MILDMLARHSDVVPKPCMMVAPILADVPPDSLLSFETVESFVDLLRARDNHKVVVMIRDDQLEMVECYAAHPALFEFEMVVITGLPGATYSPEFESACYRLARVAYHTLVGDLAELMRRGEAMAAENRSERGGIYQDEKKQYTRKDGSVKEFKAFDAPNMPLADVVPGTVSEEPDAPPEKF